MEIRVVPLVVFLKVCLAVVALDALLIFLRRGVPETLREDSTLEYEHWYKRK